MNTIHDRHKGGGQASFHVLVFQVLTILIFFRVKAIIFLSRETN
jgi:hypothetical protein